VSLIGSTITLGSFSRFSSSSSLANGIDGGTSSGNESIE